MLEIPFIPEATSITVYQEDAESSWGEPERVADCIWDAHTDMQLFVQPDYLATLAWAKLHSQTMSKQGDPCYV